MAEPRIGLALGGGGARGLAHIPALEALDELGLKPACIAGTSIGAIIGAAYASGLSGADIRAHALAALADQGKVFARLMQLRPKTLRELFDRQSWGGLRLDPERILALFLPGAVARDFAELATPLTIVATDYYGWHEQDIVDGDLHKAIAASIALPMLFRPVRLNGRVMMDGGLVNPLPADKVTDADLVIAIDVVGGPEPRGGRDMPGAADAIFGATQILMQTIISERLRHDRPDILIRPDINRFRILDFLKVRAILKAAEPVKDELKRRIGRIVETA